MIEFDIDMDSMGARDLDCIVLNDENNNHEPLWFAQVQTCQNMSVDETQQFYCSECECTVDIPLLWGVVNFCPDCGCKVVDNADK